jgi:hypothetical protein
MISLKIRFYILTSCESLKTLTIVSNISSRFHSLKTQTLISKKDAKWIFSLKVNFWQHWICLKKTNDKIIYWIKIFLCCEKILMIELDWKIVNFSNVSPTSLVKICLRTLNIYYVKGSRSYNIFAPIDFIDSSEVSSRQTSGLYIEVILTKFLVKWTYSLLKHTLTWFCHYYCNSILYYFWSSSQIEFEKINSQSYL